jgi:hypothetical protein
VERTSPIIVRRLRVDSISDPTHDPYGQPGFSALIAYVDADDAHLLETLRQAADSGEVVIVRCATLEVEGWVGKRQFAEAKAGQTIEILVDDLRYFKPTSAIPVERRRLSPRKS